MGLIDKVINIKVIADKTIVIVVVKGRGRFARGEANQNNLCSGGREGGGGIINHEVRTKNPFNSCGKSICCSICESIVINNEAHMTTVKLPFLLKRSIRKMSVYTWKKSR